MRNFRQRRNVTVRDALRNGLRNDPPNIVRDVDVYVDRDNTNTTRAREITDPKPSSRFDEWWARYPRKVGRERALHAWCFVVNSENEAQVFACLERYLDSEESVRACMSAEKWLNSQARDAWAGVWPARHNNGKQSELDEAIRRVMPR